VRVGGRVNAAALENDAFTLVESVGLALRQTDVPGLIRINLMPPELVAQARNVRRIPFLVVGALGVLGALGLGIVWQNRECDVVKAQLEEVQSQNDILSKIEGRLKKAQGEEKSALAACDELQKLMRSRTVALERMRAVSDIIKQLPGTWIYKWEKSDKSADGTQAEGEESSDRVTIVVCYWKDQKGEILEKWKSANKDGRSETEIGDAIKKMIGSVEGLVAKPQDGSDAVKAELRTGTVLDEIELTFTFAPVASVDPNPTAQKQNKKGR
jgi:hypothetical protein